MGQQPNVELTKDQLPKPTHEPDAARRWRPTRPGVITRPDQMPWGGAFGTPGPDMGYALVIIRANGADLTEGQQKVVAALMAARASRLGRAPTAEDLDVARLIAGIGDGLPANLVERGVRWVTESGHERTPGRHAVAEAEPDLLVMSKEEARRSIQIVGGEEPKAGTVPGDEDRPLSNR